MRFPLQLLLYLITEQLSRGILFGQLWSWKGRQESGGDNVTTEDLGLLQAIHEDPVEDTPRLIYADWHEENGDPLRAELIRLQCDQANLIEGDPRQAALHHREQELSTAHKARWTDCLPTELAHRCEIVRGTMTMNLELVARLTAEDRQRIHQHRWHFPEARITPREDFILESIRADGLLDHFPMLDVSHSWITNSGLATLGKLSHLRSLRLAVVYDIDNAGMQHLANLPRLQSLDVGESALTVDGLDRLGKLRSLRRLRIRHLNDGNVEHLSRFSQLRFLDVSYVSLVGPNYQKFLSLSEMEHLRLSTLSVLSAEAIRHLSQLPQLRKLELEAWQIREAGLRELGRFDQLRTLKLPWYSTCDGSRLLIHLQSLQQLRELYAGSIFGPDEAGFSALSALTELETLGLQRTGITGRALRHLRPLKNLRALSLSGTGASDAGIRYLLDLPALRWLDVRWSKITAKGREQIRKEMPHVYLAE